MPGPRTVPVVALCCLLTACTGPERAPAPVRSAAAAVQSAGGPRVIACAAGEAHVATTWAVDEDTVAAGPVSWPDLEAWAAAEPADRGDPVTGDYKIGAVVRAGAVVTVTVPESHRGRAGLRYGQGWGYTPAQSVTFHGCPSADTAYIGGFHVQGRLCVPLDVTAPGSPPVRVTVSFFAGACGTGVSDVPAG